MSKEYNDLSVRPIFPLNQFIQHPRQVKSPQELEVGKPYVLFHRGRATKIKYLVRALLPIGLFDADEIFENGFTHRDLFSMGDNGILPYESGIWNDVNCLVPEEVYLEEQRAAGMKSMFG